MKKRVLIFIMLIIAAQLLGVRMARSQTCKSTESSRGELLNALSNAQPGDTICISDGTYSGWNVDIPSNVKGSQGNMIIIKPKNPDGVTFTGSTKFKIRGNYIHLTGVTFDETSNDALIIYGNSNRFSFSTFIDSGNPNAKHTRLVQIWEGGSNNEIDHNTFSRSLSMSIGLRMPQSGDNVPRDNHIHNNQFLDIGSHPQNPNYACSGGQEAIQLGTNPQTHKEMRTLVEYNTIERFTAHNNGIAIKSSGNIIRYNLFRDNQNNDNCGGQGILNIRAGQNNILEGNVLINNKHGISLSGINGGGIPHKVINNFVYDSGSLYLHIDPVRLTDNALIAHNTFVTSNQAIFFGQGSKGQLVNNNFINNIFIMRNSNQPPIGTHNKNSNRVSLSDLLDRNTFNRNIFFWISGQSQSIPDPISGSDKNFIDDPKIDTNNPLLPALYGNSPAIDAALSGIVNLDIRERSRNDGFPDIGAFEMNGNNEQRINVDLNNDNKVNLLDILIIIKDYGKTSGISDLNDDDIIDHLDILEVIKNWF